MNKEEFKEAQITRLEQSLQDLKEKLLPDRSEQYKTMNLTWQRLLKLKKKVRMMNK